MATNASYRTVTCSCCGNRGHNRRTCPQRNVTVRSRNTRPPRQMRRRRVRVPPAEVRRANAQRQHQLRNRLSSIDLINQAMNNSTVGPIMEFIPAETLTDDMVTIAKGLVDPSSSETLKVQAMQVAVRLCAQINMLQQVTVRDMDMVKGIEDKLNVATNVIGKMTNPKSNITLTQLEDCPICFEKIVGPKIVCQNGHSICNGCLGNMLKTTVEGHKCPCCRVEL